MNIFGIGLPEMALIFIIALLIFGPKKLPEIGRSLGKTLRSFQNASSEFQEEFKKEADKIEKAVTMQARLEESDSPANPVEASDIRHQTSDINPEVVETTPSETTKEA